MSARVVDARRRGPTRVLFLAALLAVPGPLVAQGTPVGPEFQVNTYVMNAQDFPSIAVDPAGDFVVAWESTTQDGNGDGIFAQRYSGTGAPLGAEFQVNANTTYDQINASVASDSAGNFVVVWESPYVNGLGYMIQGQRYASTGVPLGGEFRVNTYTTYNKLFPKVVFAAGSFIVVWQSYFQEGPNFGVYARRFSGTGAPLGGEFRVNTFTPGYQGHPSVASDPAGNFVVAWHSLGQDGSGFGVFAQRFDSTGTPVGGEFRVNTYTTSHQGVPTVASDAASNFVVVWESPGHDGNSLFGQRYASTGSPLGGEFRINTFTPQYQHFPVVASDPVGNFVVVWHSGPQSLDGSGYGVFAQRFASTGAPLGGEFLVNTHTTQDQRHPSVAVDPGGRFVVVWDSNYQDGDATGVFGQRYSMIVPVELVGFRVE
jgi:hypothetical protein